MINFYQDPALTVKAVQDFINGVDAHVNVSGSGIFVKKTASLNLSNIPAATIRRVQLYNNAGLLQKEWTTAQASYDIKDIPAGIYHLQIDLEDGSHQYFKISK